MVRYRKKHCSIADDPGVEAIQWDGENSDVIISFGGCFIDYDGKMRLKTNGIDIVLSINDWIIRHPSGNLGWHNNYYFLKNYKLWFFEDSDNVGNSLISNYSSLKEILNRAYKQAADGKGKERHANNKNFKDQPIIRIQELVGTGFVLGQAVKKIEESQRMDKNRASIELLGAIVYLGAAIYYRENIE